MMMKTLLKHCVCGAADVKFSAKIHSVYRVLVGTDRGFLAARHYKWLACSSTSSFGASNHCANQT